VKAVIHTHSSHLWGAPAKLLAPLGLSASSLMDLIADFDPQHVGAYVAPAHLSLDGEPVDLALDILKDRVAIVAVKNMDYHPTEDGGTTVWHHKACPLPEGLVDWRAAVASLRASGYCGWLNLHAEFNGRYASGDRAGVATQPWQVDSAGNLADTPPVLDLLERDIAYLTKIVSGS
jgi:hypothetical protein